MKWELPAMRMMAKANTSVLSIMLNDALDEVEKLQKRLAKVGKKSDGYHTFDELYDHRTVLFALVCQKNRINAWKSRFHSDDTILDGWFIVGMNLPNGQVSYHVPVEKWSLFDVPILDRAPEWDGHTPNDVITRLRNWLEML